MAFIDFPVRRLIVAGSFAAAIAITPVIAVLAGPSSTSAPMAACPAGEQEDPYTYACVPELVPAGSGGTGGVASPSIGAPSEQQLTECSGRNQGNCVEQDYYGSPSANVPRPNTTVQQSP